MEHLETFFDWFLENRIVIQSLAIVSVAVAVLSLAGVVIVLVRLPEDYFVTLKRHPLREEKGARVSFPSLVKNAAGIAMIIAGLFMLVLPGQGMLFILAGLFFTNFPGKFRLERRIIGNPPVARGVNRLRAGFARPPLQIPEPSEKVARASAP